MGSIQSMVSAADPAAATNFRRGGSSIAQVRSRFSSCLLQLFLLLLFLQEEFFGCFNINLLWGFWLGTQHLFANAASDFLGLPVLHCLSNNVCLLGIFVHHNSRRLLLLLQLELTIVPIFLHGRGRSWLIILLQFAAHSVSLQQVRFHKLMLQGFYRCLQDEFFLYQVHDALLQLRNGIIGIIALTAIVAQSIFFAAFGMIQAPRATQYQLGLHLDNSIIQAPILLHQVCSLLILLGFCGRGIAAITTIVLS
mmetsp:Transcript_45207/g.109411  ORF Transcript_45207/g.109411 Transcript_45207/m.109411 type:complete len:252 (+) Transcript_45207:906-1661(+)